MTSEENTRIIAEAKEMLLSKFGESFSQNQVFFDDPAQILVGGYDANTDPYNVLQSFKHGRKPRTQEMVTRRTIARKQSQMETSS